MKHCLLFLIKRRLIGGQNKDKNVITDRRNTTEMTLYSSFDCHETPEGKKKPTRFVYN